MCQQNPRIQVQVTRGLTRWEPYATRHSNFALSSLYPLPWSLYPFPAFAPFTLPSSQVHVSPCCPSAGSPATRVPSHPVSVPPDLSVTHLMVPLVPSPPFAHPVLSTLGVTCSLCF